MHIIKVKRDGKLDIYQTVRINLPTARVPKEKRQTLKQIAQRSSTYRTTQRLLAALKK